MPSLPWPSPTRERGSAEAMGNGRKCKPTSGHGWSSPASGPHHPDQAFPARIHPEPRPPRRYSGHRAGRPPKPAAAGWRWCYGDSVTGSRRSRECAGENGPGVGEPPARVAEATPEVVHSEHVLAGVLGANPAHQPPATRGGRPRLTPPWTPAPEVGRPPVSVRLRLMISQPASGRPGRPAFSPVPTPPISGTAGQTSDSRTLSRPRT